MRPLQWRTLREEFVALTRDHRKALILETYFFYLKRSHEIDKHLAECLANPPEPSEGWLAVSAEQLQRDVLMPDVSSTTIWRLNGQLVEDDLLQMKKTHNRRAATKYRLNLPRLAYELDNLGFFLPGYAKKDHQTLVEIGQLNHNVLHGEIQNDKSVLHGEIQNGKSVLHGEIQTKAGQNGSTSGKQEETEKPDVFHGEIPLNKIAKDPLNRSAAQPLLDDDDSPVKASAGLDQPVKEVKRIRNPHTHRSVLGAVCRVFREDFSLQASRYARFAKHMREKKNLGAHQIEIMYSHPEQEEELRMRYGDEVFESIPGESRFWYYKRWWKYVKAGEPKPLPNESSLRETIDKALAGENTVWQSAPKKKTKGEKAQSMKDKLKNI